MAYLTGTLAKSSAALALCVAAFTHIPSTQAVTISAFKGQGFEAIYGSYAPGGDCSKEPRLTIGDRGITFRANGREVTPPSVEYAASLYGQRYEGITQVFYPFRVSDTNLGPVLMFVDDDEKRGVIRFQAEQLPGQRADPFHAAFTGSRLFTLCKGTRPAGAASSAATAPSTPEVPATPAEWTNLASLVGKYPGSRGAEMIDLFERGSIAAALRAHLGAKFAVLKTNLSVVAPMERAGNLYFLSGNAEHQGGIDQAYVILDQANRALQVGLWERGKLTVYPPANGRRLPVTPQIKAMLDSSPPETATPLPGTPWELVPVQGRPPIAYVSAAASPNIESLSLYCQNGRPYMAMLLTRAAAGNALTVTWNFAGGLINIPAQRANNVGTQWIGAVSGTQLIPMLVKQTGTVMLRINGRGEGEASLANSGAVLRTALRDCAQI